MTVFSNTINMFEEAKNKMIGLLLKPMVNGFLNLKGLGNVEAMDCKTAKNLVTLDLELTGEKEKIVVQVSYEKVSESEIQFQVVECSRDWMKILVNEIIPAEKRRVKVPDAVMAMIE